MYNDPNSQPNGNGHFSTQESALAAWLNLQGHELSTIDKNRNLSTFVFKDSPNLRKDACVWQMAQAQGNCCQYEQARIVIMHLVHYGLQ